MFVAVENNDITHKSSNGIRFKLDATENSHALFIGINTNFIYLITYIFPQNNSKLIPFIYLDKIYANGISKQRKRETTESSKLNGKYLVCQP